MARREDKIEVDTSESDLNLVRSISKKDIIKLSGVGIHSYRQLAQADLEVLQKTLGWTPNKANNAFLHAKALKNNRIYPKKPLEPPDGVIYFYDIETFGRLTYLHGVIRLGKKEREERSFLAKDPADEGVAWREFIEYLSQDREAVVYSWTDFERRHVHHLWDTYGGNRKGWKLLRNNLVDQCALVKHHFALPTRSYGIKRVAPIFGFNWHTPEPSGRKAELWYGQWLKTGNENVLREIITYNLDDVRAMEAIHMGLKGFSRKT